MIQIIGELDKAPSLFNNKNRPLYDNTNPTRDFTKSAIKEKESESGAWPNGYSRVFVQLMNS